MTTDERSMMAETALKTELKALLARANDSGLNVEGGWECRNGPEHPDWDVIITEVEKTDDSE